MLPLVTGDVPDVASGAGKGTAVADEISELIEQFKRHEVDAETLVESLTELRRAESREQDASRPRAFRTRPSPRTPQGSLGGRPRDIDLRLPSLPESAPDSVPETIRRAQETLRRMERFAR